MNSMLKEDVKLSDALLKPKTVALVGISDDQSKTAGRPLHFLRNAGYKGTIYCINPRRETVQGEKAYTSLTDLPEVPDHVYVLTGAELALDAVEECGKLGVPVVTLIASGFSEAGQEGIVRENKLRELQAKYRTRILGPSSLGIVNLYEDLFLTANAAFAEPGLPKGNIFCASHSGSMIGSLTSRGRNHHTGFYGLVSVGGEVDLSVGEICLVTLDNPDIHGYMLFLESMRHADKLREFAVKAAELNRPVVVFKLGRSQVAADLAVSHTGSMAGEDAVAEAFFKDCGIARVETLDGFLNAIPLLSKVPSQTANKKQINVGVLTTTGGGAAMVVDQLGIRNVSVVSPTDETIAKLNARGVEVHAGGIIDLTLAGTKYEVMKAALEVLEEAPEFDLILVASGSSARYHPDLAVKPIVDSISTYKKPLVSFLVPDAPEALKQLKQAGVPAFQSPEACADVINAAFSRRQPMPIPAQVSQPNESTTVTLDEDSAYQLLRPLGIQNAPYQVLNVSQPKALDISYPVVVKVLHDQISHKTEVGGVILHVQNDSELQAAINQIKSNVEKHCPNLTVEKVLVQSMVKGLGEVLVGFKRDKDVGPIVMLAAGGVLTELYKDSSMRLAPVTLDSAYEMIAEVKGLKALDGFRGKQKGDLKAIAETVVAFSQLAVSKEYYIEEAEMNPLIVNPQGQGVTAVDALVHIAKEG
ncbi:acetate--CoA ligase family protein [Acinetobacter sp. ANC 4945]|uniref:6-carboxyhexanoate--CoA ligase n=1 Tax=Acinetobacter amyesii TaxID=2942470 RepID=A0A1T1GU61_9GAMM|nr:acetate--CoA ligase family protein [Acinetobacter amyesii]MCL6247928.1 acetate--CoA ligase family protein [Acinetobacter amyesii]OOV81146.1 6-carboxyhexanoate--CoA ligase [Acinetobacter amyesii]